MPTHPSTSQNNDDSEKERVLSVVRKLDKIRAATASPTLIEDVSTQVVGTIGNVKQEKAYKGMINALTKYASFPAVITISQLEKECNGPNIELGMILTKYNMHITPEGAAEFNKHASNFNREFLLAQTRKTQEAHRIERRDDAETRYSRTLLTNAAVLSKRDAFFREDLERELAKNNLPAKYSKQRELDRLLKLRDVLWSGDGFVFAFKCVLVPILVAMVLALICLNWISSEWYGALVFAWAVVGLFIYSITGAIVQDYLEKIEKVYYSTRKRYGLDEHRM